MELVGDSTAMATSFIIKGFNVRQLSSWARARTQTKQKDVKARNTKMKNTAIAAKQRAACFVPQLPTFGRDRQKELGWSWEVSPLELGFRAKEKITGKTGKTTPL